ncbi:MAG: type VI secretion system tube protein Hcp [Burkholderiaceae bacterium]|jgi:type VI secretion system secreted protein Hcp|nr:type VI secretion system tube protein Hcp [Burkholderiaceae bacterium]
MSIDCYLKLDGVKGEATQKDHKDEIEIFDWAWDVSNASCTVGSGSGVGKGTPGMLNFSKRYDSASPTLAKFSANGKHFTTATLSMAKSGEGQQTFLTVTLKELFIAGVNVNAAQGGDVRENVTVSYGDIEFAYKPQKADGSMGGDIKFGWDTRTTETR